MAFVSLKGISKRFNGVTVVRDITLDIEKGEFLTLLGPSGCGKSTILNMIAGLEEISQGELFIDGRLYNHIPVRERNVGMVFQSYALFPHMTVDQNLAFGLKIKKRARLEIFEKLDWVKGLLHLSDKGKAFPRELSGGERQRVALGRSLVLEPAVLLLDEPLSNLDQELREAMTTELKKIHQEVGYTMIYVTHNQNEAVRMSDRIAVIRKGGLVQCGTPVSIFNRPCNRFVAGFVGSPAMNMLEAGLAAAEGEAGVVVGGVRLNLEKEAGSSLLPLCGREVVAGIRPQQVYYFKDKVGRRHSDTEVEVKVVLVEPLGDRLMVNALLGSNPIVFMMVSDHLPQAGDSLRIVIDGRNIHLFEKESGERITAGD